MDTYEVSDFRAAALGECRHLRFTHKVVGTCDSVGRECRRHMELSLQSQKG